MKRILITNQDIPNVRYLIGKVSILRMLLRREFVIQNTNPSVANIAIRVLVSSTYSEWMEKPSCGTYFVITYNITPFKTIVIMKCLSILIRFPIGK